MKFCKKIIAAILTAALLLSVCAFSFAEKAEETRTPEVPEGYDGVIVMSVEALPLGIDYLIAPHYVPYHEGESVAAVTARMFDELGLQYSAGDIESFYLTALEWPYLSDITPNVPDYLMEQLIANYCYDEDEGWDQAEPTNNMLAAGNYTYYSGWMYADNDVIPNVGSSDVPVEEGHVYRWMYSIYGYGMDLGMSDGWGMFPPFENPAMGVMRSEAYTLFADIIADPDLTNLILNDDEIYAVYSAFYHAITYQGSTQEEIDAAYDALAAALGIGSEVIPGDVDGDGSVSTNDALLILRTAMHIAELEGDAAEAADVDGDGSITVSDALIAMRLAMGLIG